jgi:uncharacterized protein (DUF4415 family)
MTRDKDLDDCTESPRARLELDEFDALDWLRKPRKRGPQKTPTKVQTTIRLDREVIDHFRASGRGWQSRLNETLRRVVVAREKKPDKS